MNNIKFQYYEANIQKPKVIGTVSLSYFIKATKQPKNMAVWEQIEAAEANGDMNLKAELKKNLHAFTPCVEVKKSRSYKNIIKFNGIAVLDYDHLPSTKYSKEFKKYLFNECPFIICAYLSPSKHGVKALLKIPVCKDITEFKLRYEAITSIFEQYNGFDDTPKNCVLPLFQSYDADILVRDDADTYTEIAEQKPEPKPIAKPIHPIQTTDTQRYFIISNFWKAINSITDIGHPNIRNACFVLGGYVAGGYLSEMEAIQLGESAVYSHPYLSKKPRAYLKTIRDSISKGKLKPIFNLK